LPLGGFAVTLVPLTADCPAMLLPPAEGDAPAPELPAADV